MLSTHWLTPLVFLSRQDAHDDEHDLDKVIPAEGNVNVEYTLVDNTPGISIKTRCT